MEPMSSAQRATSITINRDDHLLIAAPGGAITGGATGFFAADTRFVSRHRITLDGQVPTVLSDEAIRFYSAEHVLARREPGGGPDGVAADDLRLTVARSVDGAVHEDLDLTNAGRAPVPVELAVEIDADFADMFEIRGIAPPLARRPTARWSAEDAELRIDYRSPDFARSLHVRCLRATSLPAWRDGRIVFDATVPAGGTWHACLIWFPQMDPDARDGGAAGRSAPGCRGRGPEFPEARGLPARTVGLSSVPDRVQAAWEQAAWDMEALRLVSREAGGIRVPGAGIPWYMTLFGRDSIITAMQAMPGDAALARGTLAALAALQGDRHEPERDMEPGKILHEIRHGEVAVRNLLPFQPYYGTHDATPLFVVLLAKTYAWTGDRALVERLLPAAEAAMRWIEGDGDRDGDGFLEYATRSSHGFPNQGWKDATDAIPREDGSLAPLPIALCEHQGYAYQARLSLASLFDLCGREADARRLRLDAADLRTRFNEAFWWEEEGTYYLGLDGQKRPIRSVASNAGLCLATGIVPRDRAERVADRLMRNDMWSGWGIRTLASTHPAYDPLSYHTGSVWPHDNAMIAAGLAATGHRAAAARIAGALFDVAELVPRHQVPELFSGEPRAAGQAPEPYPGSCVPQAWAASALTALVSVLCGLEVRADPTGAARIHVDPDLPAWLPSLRLDDVHAWNGDLGLEISGRTATVIENSTGLPVVHGAADGNGNKGLS
jgi:glycogen debranching enzyme